MATEESETKTFFEQTKVFISENWSTIQWFVAIIAILIAAALFAMWNAQRSQKFSTEELAGIQKLVHFASKSAREAQKTQDNALQSLLHTNYAICFINAARHMVGGTEALQTLTTTNVNELHQYLTQSQIQLLNKIRQQCVVKKTEDTDLLEK